MSSGINGISKSNNGAGASLINNFKDLYPDRIIKVHVYEGKNLISKDKDVFAREDDLTIISLKKIGTLDCIFGGEVISNIPNSLEEGKSIREINIEKISTISVSALLSDAENINIRRKNLFFTIGEEFSQGNINNERYDIYIEQNIVPGTVAKLVNGTSALNMTKRIIDTKIIGINFVPAITQNNMPSSKITFVDANVYSVMPIEKKDFEITSIEIKSDQTFNPEYGNWVSANGKIETNSGVTEEIDIDFKSDKPLLPVQIAPYGIKGKVQFAIDNFNKYLRMPWLYASKFLGKNTSIKGYIEQGTAGKWVNDLSTAVVNMFKLSHAFATNFSEYRDKATGEILDEKIGGVSLKSLENKDSVKAVDSVFKIWEYSYGNKKFTQEYLRALQIIVASSEWISSSFCVGKGINSFHKSKLDWYLDLDTKITKSQKSINMTLNSLRYDFKKIIVVITPGGQLPNGDLYPPKTAEKWCPVLKNNLNQSKIIIDETDRYISLPEIDDPISLETFVSFAGDIDLRKQNSLKYFVGLDITKPEKIASFFINEETSGVKIETVKVSVDTDWYLKLVNRNVERKKTYELVPGQQHDGIMIQTKSESANDRILKSVNIPNNAYDVTVISTGTENKIDVDIEYTECIWNNYTNDYSQCSKVNLREKITRLEGAEISYKIKTTSHGVKNKVMTYDKGTWTNTKLQFTDDNEFKRVLTISDDYRDNNGNPTVKIKTIDRLYFSFFLGNYLDIVISYKHKDSNNKEITGKTLIPRIELPSKKDELRTKLGIRL